MAANRSMNGTVFLLLLHMEWRIGCSGFHYKDWKGVFYPEKLPPRKWFEYYTQHFDTLELNVTFYRFPKVNTLSGWYDKSPAGFLFSVKAPRLITHFKQLIEVHDSLSNFYKTCEEGLKEKLGPILFQFPPLFSYTEQRLERIILNLDQRFLNVVEFRHPGWWNEEVYTQLGNHKIIFSGASHPSLPAQPVINNTTAYYRFHGNPVMFYSEYDKQLIKSFASTIKNNKGVEIMFCYFNNTATNAALNNADQLLSFSKG